MLRIQPKKTVGTAQHNAEPSFPFTIPETTFTAPPIVRKSNAAMNASSTKENATEAPNRNNSISAISHTNFMWIMPPFKIRYKNIAIFIIALYSFFVKKRHNLFSKLCPSHITLLLCFLLDFHHHFCLQVLNFQLIPHMLLLVLLFHLHVFSHTF